MQDRRGVLYGFVAYLMWGAFPLYFRFLHRSGPFEVVAHRIVWSLVFCLGVITLVRSWGALRSLLARRRTAGLLCLGGFLVGGNWTIYVWGVNTGRTLDAALGYFVNPLFSALLGVVLLGERLRRTQWIAFGIGVMAVVVLMLGYREVPTVALGLAFTFGLYGLVKKKVVGVDPVSGLTVETGALLPVAACYLAWLAAHHQATVDLSTGYGWVVALAGPITAVPLLFFAAAAPRVQLVTMGMLQYIAPIGQFLVGWLVFHEPMPIGRWAGFVLVWVALAIFVADGLAHQGRLYRRPATAAVSQHSS